MTQDLAKRFGLPLIQSGMRVFVHGGAATPLVLMDALLEEADRLRDVELIHLHLEGPNRHADARFSESFRVANLFVGATMRPKLDSDRVDYLPCLLSEIPKLFRSKRRPIDVALLHVSPPDSHGYCTLGTSVDVARAAFEAATVVIAQVNSQMPRVLGDGLIHISKFHQFVEVNVPLPEITPRPPGPEEQAIGRFAASIIEDGACLQVGIGAVPDAILSALGGHRHLGIHSEMWSDGALKLILKGIVDNSKKTVHPGKTVSGFVLGSKALYDFINDNPTVVQLGVDYVNNPAVISRNSRVTAINSALEVDLTGQICADSIGHRVISGVGGQMDFVQGANLSLDGKSIIAITSRTKTGSSRIVPALRAGAGVVTSRAQAHHIITEYGIADLFGLTLNERAKALIRISHPEDREFLDKEWHRVRLT